MKLLAFVDLHASFKAFKKLKEKIKKQKPDIIVCAGDLSIFEQGLAYILKTFNKFKIPFLVIHGNHETQTNLRKLSSKLKNIIYLHKKSYSLDEHLFLGYGGGGFSLTDPGLKKASKKFKNLIKKNEGKKIIFITHAPPYKTKLDKLGRYYCGNKTVRQFVRKNKIDLLICGHFHENFRKEDKIKNTKIINPGPYGKIIRI